MAEKKILYKLGVKGAEQTTRKLKGVDNVVKSMAKSVLSGAAAYFGARGLIQAFVFGMLTMVFMSMATHAHGDDHH